MKIFVDGFLHYRRYQNGCSINVVDKEKSIFLKRYELEKILSDDKLLKFIGDKGITNSVVEYFALYMGLFYINKFNVKKNHITIYSDSKLIVNQFNNRWRVNYDYLKNWQKACHKIKKNNVSVVWVSRKTIVKMLGH